MWDLPGPMIEPVSAVLAGGFLTAVPPGKSQYNLFYSLMRAIHRCDIVISNEKYVFGVCPYFWHRAPKTLEIS